MVEINDSELRRKCALFAAAAKKSASDTNREIGLRLVKLVLKGTPPLADGKKRKDHTQYLKRRILESRLPRGYIPYSERRAAHMSKKQARAYYRTAVARQGEMISGWNALAEYAKIRPPAWIARHGKKHGSTRCSADGSGETVHVTFHDVKNPNPRSRFNTARFGERALKRAIYGIEKAAEAILKRKIGRAGNRRA